MVERQSTISKSILQTLIYSDIFDYPLSGDELWKFLISKKIDKESFEGLLKNNLSEKVNFRNNLYCLSGRERIIKTRIARKKESQKKVVVAKKIIKQLSFLPTIQFIGISGALSLENSERDDDIDLFVIVSKSSLWLTRLSMIILLLLMGKYRRRNQKEVSDKICLNMLIDDGALSFPTSRQNLYTAHEIMQLMPIFDRNNMYKKFMMANDWIKKYLPNAFNRGTTLNRTSRQTRLGTSDVPGTSLTVPLNHAETIFSVFLSASWRILRFSALEHFAKVLQLFFIKKHVTTETISDGFLAFHPLDYKNIILVEYKKRLQRYEI